MGAASSKPRVLLVDDVPANLVALGAQLDDMDCELVSAGSGQEALRHLLKGEGDFAVMLLDVQMPEMDGFEVAKYAREHPSTREIPIIFLTAMDQTEANLLSGYGRGAVDVLFKPINGQIVRHKVQVFLDLYVSRRLLADEVKAHKKTLGDLEAFNYSVSHDLRAPLRPLDGFSQALLEDHGAALDDQGRDYLKRIRAAAQRMSQLIDDLLRLSRISRTEVRKKPVSLSKLARSVLEELKTDDAARAVDLVIPEVDVVGDPELLRIALENLLRNAWKFTSKKERSTIELGARRDRNETVYFVRDDGVGFDHAFAKRLFQPFQRFHSNADFDGTGIGLAIVDRIIKHHGGRLWAESTPGNGATFSFTLG